MVSKPDWCPQDVWDSAYRLGTIDAQREPIARTILNERVRAANVASHFVQKRLYEPKFPACSYHASEIYEAIRNV